MEDTPAAADWQAEDYEEIVTEEDGAEYGDLEFDSATIVFGSQYPLGYELERTAPWGRCTLCPRCRRTVIPVHFGPTRLIANVVRRQRNGQAICHLLVPHRCEAK